MKQKLKEQFNNLSLSSSSTGYPADASHVNVNVNSTKQTTPPSSSSSPTSKMVLNDNGSAAVASVASLLSSLSITISPSTCDADAYLTEAEILRAYQGWFLLTLCPPLPLPIFGNLLPRTCL